MIFPNWILTAAHCIDVGEDDAPLRPIVYCGIDRLDQTDTDLVFPSHCLNFDDLLLLQTFDVRLSHLHPSWKSGRVYHGYDIALIKLERNASLALEDLPELDAGYIRFKSGESLTALGWGKTLKDEVSNKLQMARRLEFVPSDTCNEKWWGGEIKEERMTCAGLGRERVCEGAIPRSRFCVLATSLPMRLR